jgi:predicted ATPase/DNA-binding winged helix-turn-helix (wHTH) protein
MPEQAATSVERTFAFGPFRLLPARQLLLEGDRPVRLGSRALDLLATLVERAGDLVTKDELIARVWPGLHVEEGNLRVHVAAVRRALGDGQAGSRYLANVPGRGYRFVAPVVLTEGQAGATSRLATVERAHNLPAPLTRMVGRSEIVQRLVAQRPQLRLITIIGAGGIGKTTVALAVAERLVAAYDHGVRLVDLAPLGNPELVPSTLAAVLGREVRSGNPIPGVIAFLEDKQMLLVLDNCEHVIEAVAAVVAAILKGAPDTHILATSREPLLVEGEQLHRLSPLAVPAGSAGLTAAEALVFPAVQLFVERAAASLDGFELADADAPLVAEICRRLDGIALAIELAAGRIDAFGIRGLAGLLDDRLQLLRGGRRSALPRHRAMSAVLDWSYQLLPESERVILRRLAVIAGDFLLDSASTIASGADIDASDVVEGVANLVAKSLVTADVGGPTVRYRLLDTTRAYALQKLRDSGELERLARRHAEHYRDLFERAEAEWETEPTDAWLAAYAFQIDNVRAALDWAFSPGGDVGIGVALTIAAVPLWTHLSLNEECHTRVERAISGRPSGTGRSPNQEMRLFAALAAARIYTRGPAPETNAAWATALQIAEDIKDTDYQLRALWGLWSDRFNNGKFRAALEFAERFRCVAANTADTGVSLIGDRLVSLSLFYLGDLTNARLQLENMLSGYVRPVHRSHIIRFQFDQRLVAQSALARILWMQGFPDQAMSAVERLVEEGRGVDHAMSLALALAQGACPVAILTGDLAAAERFVAMLLEHSRRHALHLWHTWAGCFKGLLLIAGGDLETGLDALLTAVGELPKDAFHMRYTLLHGNLAEALGRVGEIRRGLATIDEAIARSERHEERWCFAELLRIKGELVRVRDAPTAAAAAEKHFLDSLDWARRQRLWSWELRTAMSLARLRREQGRIAEAHDLLASVYHQFTEGFGTADLKAAKRLMDELT